MGKLNRIASNPAKYAGILLKKLLQASSYSLARAAFRLEGQMDIHPSSLWYDPAFTARFGGFQLPGDFPRNIVDLDPWDSVRRDMIVLLLRQIVERGIPGDFAELGVFKGRTAKLIHYYAPERTLHLFDTFAGFDPRDIASENRKTTRQPAQGQFADTSVEGVLGYISPLRDTVCIHAGFFPESVPAQNADLRYSLVHLDADLYAPILSGLNYFYPRMSPGGLILIHDFNAWPGARTAVTEFFHDKPEIPIPMPDKSGSALVVKSAAGA